MRIGEFKDLTKNIKVWLFWEEGWWYSKLQGVFFTKEEAAERWEDYYSVKYSEEEAKKIIKKTNTNVEGFWYYTIEETTLDEVVDRLLEEHEMVISYKLTEEIRAREKKWAEEKIRNQVKTELKAKVMANLQKLLDEKN